MIENLEKRVRVTVNTGAEMALHLLKPLQGDLKTLSMENAEKLRSSILIHGFAFPIFVWECQADGQLYILDGHQRYAVLEQLRAEGYALPQIPIVVIPAKDVSEAKAKLLVVASQYGKLSQTGFERFVSDVEHADLSKIIGTVALPEMIFPDSIDISAHQRSVNLYQETEMPSLTNDGEPSIKQVTFLMHKDQLAELTVALDMAKKLPDIETSNENKNGNNLHKLAKYFLDNYE